MEEAMSAGEVVPGGWRAATGAPSQPRVTAGLSLHSSPSVVATFSRGISARVPPTSL